MPLKVPLQQFFQVPPQAPDYASNPFLTGTVPHQPLTIPSTTTVLPSYENNPFLNVHNETLQESNVIHLVPKPIPVNTYNPFLHPESSQTTSHPPITEASTLKPILININNPFLNQHASTPSPSIKKPEEFNPQTSTHLPIEQPRIPLPAENEKINQLRSFCAKPRGQFPSDRCNTFVNCWDYVAVEQTCPPGLVFNYAGYCDYPQNVDCHGRSFEEVLVVQPPETVSLVISGEQHTNHIEHGNKPVHPSTPCNHVEVSTAAPIEYVPKPVDARLRTKCLRPRGQFPSDECNKYVECWDDNVAEVECPKGLYFSEKGYCDYLYNVNCHTRTVVREEIASPCPRPDGSFRDVDNCRSYFVCISNVVVGKHECPVGLYFNDIIGVCDYSHNVNCKREPFVYQQPQTANTVQKIPAGILGAVKDCQPGKVFRLNNDCSSAVLCRKGETEVVYCPNGLAYDAPSDRCLPLQIAKCDVA
ncbi:probable chitinase 10 isoform X2 [Photinus pyralis]|nr:probable chitinase 10 [Photinus pyralis]XP_031333260.1 probable chitinase 10 isoform X2 [Photinus pyralis]XP_031333261.1 probable chitinase 10 isoform X2 [Photinus pyralis]